MSRVVVMALALSFAMAAALAVTAVQSGSCIFLTSPPSYTFIGGGFHMQLALEYPLPAKDVRLSFDLPKFFFVDEAEAEQLYRMEVLSADPMTQGTAAVVVADVTRAYSPLRMSSRYAFDIEAPVFKVNYTTNHVELTFQQLGGDGTGSALDAYLAEDGAQAQVPFRARLVIPIHSRYEVLDTKTPFSLLRFITGAYRSSATVAKSEEKPHYKHCLDLPVGLLADLPYVYHALMGLLVAGAALVILAIR